MFQGDGRQGCWRVLAGAVVAAGGRSPTPMRRIRAGHASIVGCVALLDATAAL